MNKKYLLIGLIFALAVAQAVTVTVFDPGDYSFVNYNMSAYDDNATVHVDLTGVDAFTTIFSTTLNVTGSGMNNQTVDSFGNTGSYSSINLIPSTGNPAIAFYNTSQNDGDYVYWDGSNWQNETFYGDAGAYNSLVFNSTSNALIASTDGVDIFFFFRDSVGWHGETVDGDADTDSYPDLEINSTDGRHICYFDSTNNDIEYAWQDGSTTWNSGVTIDATAAGWCSIDVNSTDDVIIAYEDSDGSIDIAAGTLGHWSLINIEDRGTIETISLDIDDNDGIHITYVEENADDLIYLYSNDDGASWTSEIVNDNPYDYSGNTAEVRADSSDNPRIVYSELQNGIVSVNYTYWNTSNWVNQTIAYDSAKNYYYPSLILDSGDHYYISYYDSTDDDLLLASEGCPEPFLDVGNDGSVNWPTDGVAAGDAVCQGTTDQAYANYGADSVAEALFLNSWQTQLTGNSGDVNIYLNWSTETDGNFTVHDLNLVYAHFSITDSYPTEDSTFEGASVPFNISLGYDENRYDQPNVSAYFNNTYYWAEVLGTGVNETDYGVNITMPAVASNTNISYYYIISFDGTNYTLLADELEVIDFNVDDCSTNPYTFLNVSSWMERDVDNALNTTLEVTFTVNSFNDTDVGGITYSFLSEDDQDHLFCMSDNGSIELDAEMRYIDTAENYDPRNYYLINADFESNVTTEVPVYLLEDNRSTTFEITVYDSDMEIIEDAYVQTQRYYIDENVYRVVEVSKTDANGETVNGVELEDPFYRYIIYEEGQIVYTGVPTKAYCTDTPCTLDLQVIDDTSFFLPVEGYDDVQYSLTFNESSTNIIRYEYVDTSGTAQFGRLIVTQRFLNTSNAVTVCNTTAYSNGATLTCDLSGNTTGTFFANAYISRSPPQWIDNLVVSFSSVFDIFTDEGLWWALAIIVTLSLVAIWNPIASIFMGIFSVIMLSFLGIIALPYSTLLAVAIIAIVLIWRMRS